MCNSSTIARRGLAGFVFVMLSASLAQADYGPRTRIGANYQQTSNTTSVDGINAGDCDGDNHCYVLFQQAPQQRPLIIQHVSCRVSISTGVADFGILATRKGDTLLFRQTQLLPVKTSDNWWVINDPVMHLQRSGERSAIVIGNSLGANWPFFVCNISGQLQQP